jgi:hypothetical protein
MVFLVPDALPDARKKAQLNHFPASNATSAEENAMRQASV